MSYKVCPKCGKIHKSSYQCNVGKIYRRVDEDKLRNKYAWAKKSEEIRERASYLCEVCRDLGRYTYENLEVHHIEKLREQPNLLLEDDNLICLCVEHHKEADRGELSKDYLRNLASVRDRGYPPGVFQKNI